MIIVPNEKYLKFTVKGLVTRKEMKTMDTYIMIRIDSKTKEKAKKDAKKQNRTLSKYIIQLILENHS